MTQQQTAKAKRTLALRKPRKFGRRTIHTPQLQRRICQLLEKGNTIIATCDHVGIGEKTFYDWCEQRPQFAQATNRARGKARIAHVKAITEAGKTDWRARAWLLSHVWPLEYSETNRMEIDGRHVGVILLPQKELKDP
jgi:hypothetical protein